MRVEVLPNVTILYLHGNAIAFRYNATEGTKKQLLITNCGWFSNTTKERLNALPNVHIQQKNFVWYLNGKEWNGQKIDIKTLKQEEQTQQSHHKIALMFPPCVLCAFWLFFAGDFHRALLAPPASEPCHSSRCVSHHYASPQMISPFSPELSSQSSIPELPTFIIN